MSPAIHRARGGLVALVGSHAPDPRTSTVARVVADGLVPQVGGPPEVVELADHGAAVVTGTDHRVRAARELVAGARVLVVATPVHKAAYTGLLKVFLDGLDPTALEETVVVPVVLSASSANGASADLQLRTVLQALGASLPVPSFVLEEHHLDSLPQYVDAWLERFGQVVGAVARVLRPEAGLPERVTAAGGVLSDSSAVP